MNDGGGGGEVARAFFLLSRQTSTLSLLHTLFLSPTLSRSLQLCVSLCLLHARTEAPHKVSPPHPSLTTAESLPLLLLLQYYYDYYNKILLLLPLPPLAHGEYRAAARALTHSRSAKAATNDGGRRRRPLMKK